MKVRRAYPVGLGGLLHQDSRVGPMLPGLPTHHAQQLPVVLAVVVQLLLVPLTQLRILLLPGNFSWLSALIHLQPFDVLHQAGQLPHRSDVLLFKRLLAEGADRAAPRDRTDISGTAAAEDVATINGHRVSQVIQADGAGHLLLQAPQWC